MIRPSKELDVEMALANGVMAKRFSWSALLVVAIFIGCQLLGELSTWIAHGVADYVPAIRNLLDSDAVIASMSARFFSVCTLFFPLMVGWLLWGQSPIRRAQYGAIKSGVSFAKFLVRIYLMGVPFGLGFLILIYYSPIPASPEADLWGEVLLNVMLNTSMGLFTLGSSLVLATVAIAVMTAMYLVLPVQILLKRF